MRPISVQRFWISEGLTQAYILNGFESTNLSRIILAGRWGVRGQALMGVILYPESFRIIVFLSFRVIALCFACLEEASEPAHMLVANVNRDNLSRDIGRNHRRNRNPRPQPEKFSKLVSLITFMYSYIRKAGWSGWKPSSSSNFSIRVFRAQISQFEPFELILLLKLDKQFPVERFEAAASQSAVPSPLS